MVIGARSPDPSEGDAMSYGGRKRRRRGLAPWKLVRWCVVFFITICMISMVLVLLVTTDQYMMPGVPEFGSMDGPHGMFQANWDMILTAARIEKRRKHLRKACRDLGLDIVGNDSLHKPNAWEFLVDETHHLVWCNVFKAASTSWMYNFNLLGGYSPGFLKKIKVPFLSLARQRFSRPSLDELKRAFNNSVSFLIVRHPLERLLSAYRRNIRNPLQHTYLRKLGKEIVKKYRKDAGKKMIRYPTWPTFPEFVSFLLDAVRQRQVLDMHWTPITEFCTPCMFDFKVIAHTETLQDDQKYIIYKAGLQDLLKPQWMNPSKGPTAEKVETYYSQLTRAQILQLYHIYRYDFELFDYTLKGYLEWGQPDKDPSMLLAAISMKDKPQPQRRPST